MSSKVKKLIPIRLSQNEYDIIENKANILSLSISTYIRLVSIHVNIDKTILNKINDDPDILILYSNRDRYKIIQVNTSQNEYDIIENKANMLDLNVSDYIRLVSIFADVNVNFKK